jgi:hypothetical protein
MFYYPNREPAQRIQATLKTIYDGVSGEYYAGEEAWAYVNKRTAINLKDILFEIAEAKNREAGGKL